MTDFEKTFLDAIGWIAREQNPTLDIAELTSFEEDVQTEVGCETCGPGTTVDVDVWYRDSAGRRGFVTIYGSLQDLLPKIAQYEGWAK